MVRPLAHEGAHRFGQADVVESGGSEFPRQEIHVTVKALCDCFRLFQFLAYFPVSAETLIERREIQTECSHLLANLIVYVARDAAAFVLLGAHDLAKQADSIPFGLYAVGD